MQLNKRNRCNKLVIIIIIILILVLLDYHHYIPNETVSRSQSYIITHLCLFILTKSWWLMIYYCIAINNIQRVELTLVWSRSNRSTASAHTISTTSAHSSLTLRHNFLTAAVVHIVTSAHRGHVTTLPSLMQDDRVVPNWRSSSRLTVVWMTRDKSCLDARQYSTL